MPKSVLDPIDERNPSADDIRIVFDFLNEVRRHRWKLLECFDEDLRGKLPQINPTKAADALWRIQKKQTEIMDHVRFMMDQVKETKR